MELVLTDKNVTKPFYLVAAYIRHKGSHSLFLKGSLLFVGIIVRLYTGKPIHRQPCTQIVQSIAHNILFHVSPASYTSPIHEGIRVIIFGRSPDLLLIVLHLLILLGRTMVFCKTVCQLTVAGQYRIFTFFPFNHLNE